MEEKKVQVVHMDKSKRVQIADDIVIGTALRQPVTDGISETVRVGLVDFEEGAGNKPHTHVGDQILIITEGECVVTTDDGEFVAGVGDVVIIPAGAVHTHCARSGKIMSHWGIMAIQPGITKFSSKSE